MNNLQVSQASQAFQVSQASQDSQVSQASQDIQDSEDLQTYQADPEYLEYLEYLKQTSIRVQKMSIEIHNRVGNFPIVPSPAGSHGLYITIYADTPTQRTISCTVPMYEFDKYEMMDIESKELIGAFESIESMCTALLHIIV